MQEERTKKVRQKNQSLPRGRSAPKRKALSSDSSLIDNLNDALYAVEPDGTITFVTARISDITGYSPRELIGRRFTELIHPDDLERAGRGFDEVSKGSAVPADYRVLRKDGEICWVRISSRQVQMHGRFVGIRGVLSDITDGKAAEAALKQSEEKFLRVFQSSPVLMAISTIEDGRFLEVNDCFLSALGYRREEVIGKTSKELNLFADSSRRDDIIRALREKGSTWDQDVQIRTRTGELRDGVFSAEIIELQTGKCLLTVMNDVTDRRQLLNDLTQKNKELETLIHAASHDLRSPLVNIQGFSRRLAGILDELQRLPPDAGNPDESQPPPFALIRDRAATAMQFILASVAKMDLLINGLLQVARAGRVVLQIEKLEMNPLLESILAAMTIQVQEARARVELDVLPPCQGDRGQINRVFSNLLDNALKYRDPDRPLHVRVSGKEEKGRVVYAVADTGKGISAEHQEKIWALFHRLEPQAPVMGDGLGLTLARRIVERHNGRLWVESTPGAGSRFCVELPARGGGQEGTGDTGNGKKAEKRRRRGRK